jgi:hypothetical protein
VQCGELRHALCISFREYIDAITQERIMGIFDRILDKLGIAGVNNEVRPRAEGVGSDSASRATDSTPSAHAEVSAPNAITTVDVHALLEQKAAESGRQLNWRTSIVDLLKVLGVDSSLEARRKLAQELACPPELMNNTADMNIWLHKELLKRVAESGGNVPAELLA